MSEYPDQQKLLHELRTSSLGKRFLAKQGAESADPFYSLTLESLISQAYEACAEQFPVFYQNTLRELCHRCLEKESLSFSKELEMMLNDQRYRRIYLAVQETRTLKAAL